MIALSVELLHQKLYGSTSLNLKSLLFPDSATLCMTQQLSNCGR